MGAMRRTGLRRGIRPTIFGIGRKRKQPQEFPMGIISRTRAVLGRIRTFDPETAYLNESTSLVDLESRQREIDRGKFKQRNWPY
jgi:hypothetical protein